MLTFLNWITICEHLWCTCDVSGAVEAVMESKRRLGLALWSLEGLRGAPRCILHRCHYKRLCNWPVDPVWSSVALHGSDQPLGREAPQRHHKGVIGTNLTSIFSRTNRIKLAHFWPTFLICSQKKKTKSHPTGCTLCCRVRLPYSP